jgi:hypothetical protein
MTPGRRRRGLRPIRPPRRLANKQRARAAGQPIVTARSVTRPPSTSPVTIASRPDAAPARRAYVRNVPWPIESGEGSVRAPAPLGSSKGGAGRPLCLRHIGTVARFVLICSRKSLKWACCRSYYYYRPCDELGRGVFVGT